MSNFYWHIESAVTELSSKSSYIVPQGEKDNQRYLLYWSDHYVINTSIWNYLYDEFRLLHYIAFEAFSLHILAPRQEKVFYFSSDSNDKITKFGTHTHTDTTYIDTLTYDIWSMFGEKM